MDKERERWFLGTLMRILVTEKDSDGRMTVVEQLAPRGFSPPLHVHAVEDSILHVVTGRVTVRVGERTTVLEAGCAAFLPHGIPHTFRVESGEARLLEVSTPGGFDAFVMENSTPAESSGLPTSPPTIDPETLGRSAARHGTPIIGPPLT